MEFLAEGSPDTVIDSTRSFQLVSELLSKLRTRGPLNRVLIVPPDITRFYSGAGELTVQLYQQLVGQATIAILPALGTHEEMSAVEKDRMFPGIPHELFYHHDWRNGVVSLGEIPATFIREVSEGKLDFTAQVQIDKLAVEEPWDAIISVGQLVPHEVIGIANHNKNIFVGIGGSDLINKSHWLGAVHGMERMMGRADTPVRRVLNYASDHFAKHLPIVYLLTVRGKDKAGKLVTKGLFAGDDAACYHTGAELCRRVNLDILPKAPKKVVVYLEAEEFRSTWLGNKAVYRTRMAIADAGELIVLAPGVRTFGEDPTIDRLIRKHGYRGTPETLARVKSDPELGKNLSAAAHLIHGSSEGRFQITYAPGHLTEAELKQVNFGYAPMKETMERYPHEKLKDGWNDWNGEEIFFVSNPGLGLWGTAERFGL